LADAERSYENASEKDCAQGSLHKPFLPQAAASKLRQGVMVLVKPRQSFGSRLFRASALILLAMAIISAPATASDSANALYKKGKDAEARQNYEAAYTFYKEAFDQKPKETRYRSAYDRIRFYAAASKVHRGQILRDGGKLEEALAEFQAAAAIDPALFIAKQEIERTRGMIEAGRGQPAPENQAPAPPPGKRDQLSRLLEGAQGPVELGAISNQPITLKLTEDSRMVYETIGKLAGINVLFDPDYTSRRIKLELNGVSLQEALETVAFESKTFWRPVTPNTIFVAADTTSKRKELEQNVVKTFYLSNLSQPTELQDVVNAMRTILEISRVQPLPSQNAIVVRGTPDQVALAEKLVGDFDKAKPEVLVDVVVMQVRRDKTRDLGVVPPTSASVQLTPLQNSNTTTTTTTTTGTTTTPTTPTNNLTFNTFKHLGSNNYAVTLNGATLNFLFSDANSKIIQQPQIRSLDGSKGSIKIGQRVPVATGSFGIPTIAGGTGGGFNGAVNTQFQYIDVGVNIDITPKVHANNEVSLKIMVDISEVDNNVSIGGINQPVIGQRKVEHEIRLKEGEANLMGGILEDQDIKSWSGIPGLGHIPLFRYLFASQHTEKHENEIVFVLIPHIVRSQELTTLNTTPLDVGGGTGISLRRGPKSEPAAAVPNAGAAPNSTTAPAQSTGGTTMAGMNMAGQQNAATPPASAGSQPSMAPSPAGQANSPTLRLDPASTTMPVGSTVALNVLVDTPTPLQSLAMQLKYDPAAMQLVSVENGGFLSHDGQPATVVHRDRGDGTVQLSGIRAPGAAGVSGQGSVFTLTFRLTAPGNYTISPVTVAPRDTAGQAVSISSGSAQISVQAAAPK
jgi:general secretion pathway protein D